MSMILSNDIELFIIFMIIMFIITGCVLKVKDHYDK